MRRYVDFQEHEHMTRKSKQRAVERRMSIRDGEGRQETT